MKNKSKYLLLGFLVVCLIFLAGCAGSSTEAVKGWSGIMDILVWPMTLLMYFIGKTVAFYNYGLTILIATIVVRSLAWPIYAKTNDMTLKMQLMAPEQAKLEAKYAGKDDPVSNQKKQMETMQLYKKYGIGLGGCLVPLFQLPLFLAFFQTLQRIPATRGDEFRFDFSFMKGNILGIDLFQGKDLSGYQHVGVIVFAVLVGLTQLASQMLANRRQKKIRAESQSNLPAYRQQAQGATQKQTEMTMKVMMYVMTGMMVVFVYTNTAALGLYWLVGNIYTALQGYIGYKQSEKRKEKLKQRI